MAPAPAMTMPAARMQRKMTRPGETIAGLKVRVFWVFGETAWRVRASFLGGKGWVQFRGGPSRRAEGVCWKAAKKIRISHLELLCDKRRASKFFDGMMSISSIAAPKRGRRDEVFYFVHNGPACLFGSVDDAEGGP